MGVGCSLTPIRSCVLLGAPACSLVTRVLAVSTFVPLGMSSQRRSTRPVDNQAAKLPYYPASILGLAETVVVPSARSQCCRARAGGQTIQSTDYQKGVKNHV